MKPVFIIADNIVSPLGDTTAANLDQLLSNVPGVQLHAAGDMSDTAFYASLFSPGKYSHNSTYTKFEQLLIASISDALKQVSIDCSDRRTGLILSSTKGNISLLETETPGNALNERISLQHSAQLIAKHFQFSTKPVVVSNACISGLLAMIAGMRMIRAGIYDQVVVSGADVITRFILSGFQSFQAVSASPCRPFDAARDGINLGEGAATVILSSQKKSEGDIRISGGSVSNDANHISGPSRTGEELFQAIARALKDAGVSAADIDFISAHGTATIYNDEMESKAINLAGLQGVPVNSLKGFYGHTLGAAGLIESVAAIQSMKKELILPTPGFVNMGVTEPVNVCSSLLSKPSRHSLKTASGFGGCNAALVLSK